MKEDDEGIRFHTLLTARIHRGGQISSKKWAAAVCPRWFLGSGSGLCSGQRRWAGGGTGGERGSQGRARRAQGRGGDVLWCMGSGPQELGQGVGAQGDAGRDAGEVLVRLYGRDGLLAA
jgi:hypothetical protein